MHVLGDDDKFISGKSVAIIALLLALVFAGLWRFTPLQEYGSLESVSASLESFQDRWWAPALIVLAYILGGLIMFPNMILNASVILTLGGFYGWLLALVGSMSSITLTYFLGKKFGKKKINEKIKASEQDKLKKVIRMLKKGGVASVIGVRVVPIAPFSVVNAVGGAIPIPYFQFMFGSFIALLPGTLTLAIVGESLRKVIADPSGKNISILIGALAAGALLVWLFSKFFKKRNSDNGK